MKKLVFLVLAPLILLTSNSFGQSNDKTIDSLKRVIVDQNAKLLILKKESDKFRDVAVSAQKEAEQIRLLYIAQAIAEASLD
ncbi:MAG: hypothetical protein QM734_06310 [Cyclobacteriaceae bacterium]